MPIPSHTTLLIQFWEIITTVPSTLIGNFSIQTTFDSQIVDDTPLSNGVLMLAFTSLPAPNLIPNFGIYTNVTNQGEPTIYKISFVTGVAYNSSCIFTYQFPKSFYAYLG